ncbi:LIC_10190 family membrane protein [Roseomonas rosulenta]|uniref:LIC_10190 family membrane protein n=1 Tax=Roseomonas rosulenta TaxID=2748667 RepID=UPI0018E02E7D|nr:hypothetical protein [Roseomonas rosulenta]
MILVAGVIGAGLAVSIGWGVLAAALLARLRGRVAPLDLGELGVLGLALAAPVGIVAHALVPLSAVVTGSAALAGLAAFAWHLPVAWRRHRAASGPVALPAALFAGLLLWAARHAYRSAAFHYDTGLYHLQVVRQAMEFPAILGIANIHERFGYNSSWPFVSAMQSLSGQGLAGAFAVNAVLLVLVAWTLAWRGWEARGAAAPVTAFSLSACAVLLVPAFGVPALLGNPNTDLPVILLVLLAMQICLRLVLTAAPHLLALLAVVVALAVTVKLAALPLVLLLLPAAFALWRGGSLGARDALAGAGAAFAIGLPALLRGVATSGCLAYPHPGTCLPLPWRVEDAVARLDMAWVQAWARQPNTPPDLVPAGWSWVPGWLDAARSEPAGQAVFVLAVLAALAGVAALAVRPAPARQAPQRAAIAMMFAASVGGIAFWFTSAPLLRYGMAWLVLPSLLALALALPVLLRRLSATAQGAASGAGMSAAAAALGGGARLPAIAAGLLAWILLVVAPTPRQLAATDYPRLPAVAVAASDPVGDLPLYRPAHGQQCWDAPRICAPAPPGGLRMARDLGLRSLRPAGR